MSGLSPTVIAKLGEGTVEDLTEVFDNGDETYAVKYAAPHIGSGYALAYSIGFVAEHEGARYTEFWPVEVVRDGREGIMSEVGGTNYAYQVRYGWSPGLPQPGDEETFYFEPRRAIQTGAEINTEKPWPNTFNHLADVKDARFLVQAPDGSTEEVAAEYAGLGIHLAAYTVEQEGDYTVSLLFTDPANQAQIGWDDNAYTLAVATMPPTEAPQAMLVAGGAGGPSLLSFLLIAVGVLMLAVGALSPRRQKG